MSTRLYSAETVASVCHTKESWKQHITSFSEGFWVSLGRTKNWNKAIRPDLKESGMLWEEALLTEETGVDVWPNVSLTRTKLVNWAIAVFNCIE